MSKQSRIEAIRQRYESCVLDLLHRGNNPFLCIPLGIDMLERIQRDPDRWNAIQFDQLVELVVLQVERMEKGGTDA